MEKLPKKVHFVRHGESFYNCFRRELKLTECSTENKPISVDPNLTYEGMQPTLRLKEYLMKTLKPEIAVSSPYSRALQTCLYSYGSENVQITALCGEIFQTSGTDDIGLPKECLQASFPMFDFSSIKDIWWYKQQLDITTQAKFVSLFMEAKLTDEPNDNVVQRAEHFLHYLCTMPQNNIVVFSHNDFLVLFLSKYFMFTDSYLDNCEVVSVDLNTACINEPNQ